jgi:hypothetical protein
MSKELGKVLEDFSSEFPESMTTMKMLVDYNVLLLEIELAIAETPSDQVGEIISDLITKFKETH